MAVTCRRVCDTMVLAVISRAWCCNALSVDTAARTLTLLTVAAGSWRKRDISDQLGFSHECSKG